jgi:heme iron utilization protein
MTQTGHGVPNPQPVRDDRAIAAYPSHAESARTLVMRSNVAVLSTLEHQLGYPYSAVSEVLPLENGDVVLFVSNLAEHTLHLQRNPKAALLYSDGLGRSQPLAHARLCLMGQVAPEPERLHRQAYLERHPSAERYIDFTDFGYFVFRPERLRFIGGFGRMGWLDAETYQAAQPDPLWQAAPGILEHMNQDHAHNILDYAKHFAGAAWAQTAVLTGIDCLGMDIEAVADKRLERLRVGFEIPLTSSHDAHITLVAMARAAKG